jgi:Ni/Fe-hydrogenase subunit HybB-like protein
MGYAGVVAQDTLTRLWTGQEQERELMPRIAKIAVWLVVAFFALRFGDLAVKGRLGLVFQADRFSVLFLAEMALAGAGAALLFTRKGRENAGTRFGSAMLLIASGALYRFDTYLIALQPRGDWSYFPSLGEVFVSLGLFALALCVFIALSKRFPILTRPATAPAAS